MPHKLIGYRTTYGSRLPAEWIEICEGEFDDLRQKYNFKRIGYPQDMQFCDMGLRFATTQEDENFYVVILEVPDNFPYFIIQRREVPAYLDEQDKVVNEIEKLAYSTTQIESADLLKLIPKVYSTGMIKILTPIYSPSTAKMRILQISSNLDFKFVRIKEYYLRIMRDYQELQVLCSVNALKSIYILTGSIIEALVTEQLLNQQEKAISQYKKRWIRDSYPEDISRWTFSKKIDISKDLKLLPPQIVMLLRDFKDHRNVVHIDFELKNSFSIDQAFAASILGAFEKLCSCLSEQAANSDS